MGHIFGADGMNYRFRLIGATPLLMHADDVLASDVVSSWRKDQKNKAVSVPGDDRSPPWTWQTYLYHDGGRLAIPSENIMPMLRHAASKIPAKKGRGTYRDLSQSGISLPESYCRFTSNGKPIPIAEINRFKDEPFRVHLEEARKLGFDLLIKRAKLSTSKNVRVRAMFSSWEVSGEIVVSEPALDEDLIRTMFGLAGRVSGLGDWRPSSPRSPGPYGMFTAEIERI